MKLNKNLAINREKFSHVSHLTIMLKYRLLLANAVHHIVKLSFNKRKIQSLEKVYFPVGLVRYTIKGFFFVMFTR